MKPALTSRIFGQLYDNTTVTAYTLKNSNGIEVEVLNYGGIIRIISLPDREGKFENCVLGFDHLEDYQTKSPYFGALIGRYGNRIAKGRFTLNDVEYCVTQNQGEHHLHGGEKGFDKVLWKVEEVTTVEGVGLDLSYVSPHMEEGYPGTLSIKVRYFLTHQNTLKVDYFATTDRPTILNLTQHSYFNLSGNPMQDCLNQELRINANHFLSVDKTMIPTGEKVAVQQTPFDFTHPQTIGKAMALSHDQLQRGNGFDHCYCFDIREDELQTIAHLFDPSSGRKIEVATTAPGMQLYTANHLTSPFVPYGAVCLETQYYPDSPNQKDFPSAVITPDQSFHSTTHFHFSID